MYAKRFENYKNGIILAQASKQASKQASRLISLSFLRAIKPNIQRTRDFFCLQDSRAGEVFLCA